MNKQFLRKKILFFLTFSCLLYGQKNRVDKPLPARTKKIVSNPFKLMAPEDVPSYVRTALLSGGVKNVAHAMKEVPVDRAIKNLEAIFKQAQDILSHEDKIILLLAVVRNYAADLEKQKKILDLLLTQAHLYQGAPLLLIATKHEYQNLVPNIVAWLEPLKKSNIALHDYLENMVFRALSYAIENNMTQPFNKLLWVGITLDQAKANQLLWLVINKQKDPRFVGLLHSLGADVNALRDGKYTPLIRATELNNKALVSALINAGATMNLIIDPATGSALQTAIGRGYKEIEMILRENEAVEPLPESF